MLILPLPAPATPKPLTGTFAAAYAPNGLRQHPTWWRRPAVPPRGVSFVPGPYLMTWGAAGGGPSNGASIEDIFAQVRNTLPSAAEAAAIYSEHPDPRVQLGVVEAKIRNYEQMKRTPPYNVVPGVLWYDNEIRKLRARALALREKVALVREGEGATRTWRTLGQTGAGVAIIAGTAVAMFFAVSTLSVAKGRRHVAR